MRSFRSSLFLFILIGLILPGCRRPSAPSAPAVTPTAPTPAPAPTPALTPVVTPRPVAIIPSRPPIPIPATGDKTPDPQEKPVPPFQIAAPGPAQANLDGQDLRIMAPLELLRRASDAASKKNYAAALALQYWYVQRTGQGQYKLACYYGHMKQPEAACYWLQMAALQDGLDAHDAEGDAGLAGLHEDPRWPKLRLYLQACNRYFESSAGRTTLVLPTGYRKGTPIPVVVWLHGVGASPDDFVNEGLHDDANRMNAAILGVSGTLPRGSRSFSWSLDPVRDGRRVQEALAGIADRVTIRPGYVVLLGFSQGAQVALELAVRDPERYAGAIALSPSVHSRLREVTPSPLLPRRGFVVACGVLETERIVFLTSEAASWLRSVRAQVRHLPYDTISAHAFPPDFGARFPEWVQFVLKARE